MKGFIVYALMWAAAVWLARDARQRRFGAHFLLDAFVLFVLGIALVTWTWEAADDGYDWWTTHRIDPDEIALAGPAELLEGPRGMLLRINLRNGSADRTMDRIRLGVRLLDCPKPEPSLRCDELWQRELAMEVWAPPGSETGAAYRRLPLPDGFHVRDNLVVDVAVLDVRNRK